MAKQYVYNFIVTGCTSFPLDMLRYDACHPHTQVDVDQLQRSLDPSERRLAMSSGEQFSVALRSYVALPEPARWSSFGWRVKETKKEARR